MAKFIWQAGVFSGSPLFGAGTATQVTVLDKSDSTLASLWSDRDGTNPKANPFFISSVGKIEFYTDAGRYRITAVNGGDSQIWDDVEVINPVAGGGGGAVSFTDLDDVPGSYAGQAGKVAQVNSGETALVFTQFGPAFNVAAATASYSLTDSLWNQWKRITGSATVEVTVPAGLADGFVHYVHVDDSFTGTCTIVASSTTVDPPHGKTLVIPAGGVVGIVHEGSDIFKVVGDGVAA